MALSPRETKEFIDIALQSKQIPYIYGEPGIGKSDVVQQVADDYNLKLIDIRLSQMLPEDLTGLPRFDKTKNKASYVPFDTFPMETDEEPKHYDGWLIFLDELSSASEEVMSAIYSLLLGRRIGNRKIHPKAVIVAAGNLSSNSAIARPLPDTLITRLLPCEMTVSGKDWVHWAVNTCKNSRQDVVDFIKKYPDMLLSSGNHNDRVELETYPTPRGWAKVFNIMALHDQSVKQHNSNVSSAIEKNDLTELSETTKALLNSAVGSIASIAFIDYYKELLQIPHAWEVAQAPSSAKIPTDATSRAQLTEDLVEYYNENIASSGDHILTYMNRLPSENKSLFVTLLNASLANNETGKEKLKKVCERLDVVHKVSGDPLGLNDIPLSNNINI